MQAAIARNGTSQVAHNHSAVPSAIAYNRTSYIVCNATSMTVHYKSADIARNSKSMIARKQAIEQNDNHASTLITGNNKEQILWKFKQQIINCQT